MRSTKLHRLYKLPKLAKLINSLQACELTWFRWFGTSVINQWRQLPLSGRVGTL